MESEQDTKELSSEVIENHNRLVERNTRARELGYDFEEGI
jgi:hypothetical protein